MKKLCNLWMDYSFRTNFVSIFLVLVHITGFAWFLDWLSKTNNFLLAWGIFLIAALGVSLLFFLIKVYVEGIFVLWEKFEAWSLEKCALRRIKE